MDTANYRKVCGSRLTCLSPFSWIWYKITAWHSKKAVSTFWLVLHTMSMSWRYRWPKYDSYKWWWDWNYPRLLLPDMYQSDSRFIMPDSLEMSYVSDLWSYNPGNLTINSSFKSSPKIYFAFYSFDMCANARLDMWLLGNRVAYGKPVAQRNLQYMPESHALFASTVPLVQISNINFCCTACLLVLIWVWHVEHWSSIGGVAWEVPRQSRKQKTDAKGASHSTKLS